MIFKVCGYLKLHLLKNPTPLLAKTEAGRIQGMLQGTFHSEFIGQNFRMIVSRTNFDKLLGRSGGCASFHGKICPKILECHRTNCNRKPPNKRRKNQNCQHAHRQPKQLPTSLGTTRQAFGSAGSNDVRTTAAGKRHLGIVFTLSSRQGRK